MIDIYRKSFSNEEILYIEAEFIHMYNHKQYEKLKEIDFEKLSPVIRCLAAATMKEMITDKYEVKRLDKKYIIKNGIGNLVLHKEYNKYNIWFEK